LTDATDAFFDRLTRRGHEPGLVKVDATVSFEISQDNQTDHWLVRIDRGDISVSRESGKATAAVRADRALFNHILQGEVYLVSAALRNDLVVEGDPALIVLLGRFLPDEPDPANSNALVRVSRAQ
jgi:hypothetical protein